MRWQVCGVGDATGTEVLGTVEAENEADASQLANEKFKRRWNEDIMVRPEKAARIKEAKKAEGRGQITTENKRCDVVNKELQSLDKELQSLEEHTGIHFAPTFPRTYSFKIEPGNEYYDGCVKDSLYLSFDVNTAYRMVQDILAQGLGQNKDNFELRYVGKLEVVRTDP